MNGINANIKNAQTIQPLSFNLLAVLLFIKLFLLELIVLLPITACYLIFAEKNNEKSH
jgi:hypothetical protein